VTRVLLISSICLYREGLTDLLSRHPRIEVVGSADTVSAGIAAFHATSPPPDVILLDMLRPDGVGAVHALRRELNDVRVLGLAVPNRESDIVAVAEAGISAFVTPEASISHLVDAIESVARDEVMCSPSMVAMFMRRLASVALDRPEHADVTSLTAREREILSLIDDGLSNKQIAQRLRIELPTVKNHVHHILGKLGVQRRAEAAAVVRSRSPY